MKNPYHSRRVVARQCTQKTAFSQRGWGLAETLLTIGALSVMSLAIYAIFKPADAAAQVRIEQENLRTLSRNVDRSFGLLGSFQGVSTSRILEDDLAPSRMRRSDGEIRTQWGTRATIAPYENPAKGIGPTTAFSVVYPGTPGEVCASLASAMGRDAFDILVNGSSVYDHNGMDPSAAAERCADGNATMEFVFHSGLVAGQAVAAPPLVLPPAPPSTSRPPSSPPVMDIPDNDGVDDANPGVIPAPNPGPASPPPPPPPITPPPPAPAPDPIVVTDPPPVPITPPGSICAPPASWTDYDYRTTVTCPAGNYGTRNERRARPVTYSCPEAWDDPVEKKGDWGSWSVTASNCTACPTLAPEVETQWLTHTGTCPTGYLGTVSHEYEQSRSRSRTHACPAGTQNLPGITLGSWSGWANTGRTRNSVNTCAPECVLPNPSTQSQREEGTTTRVANCPAGQYGQINQERPQYRTRTRTASCPAPTGNYQWSNWTSWSSWTQYGSWSNTSVSCTTCGSTTDTRTQWQSRSASCPSGQSGSHTWEELRNQSRTGTYNCPAGTRTLPSPTWGSWTNGSWTGTRRNEVNTCKPSVAYRWEMVSYVSGPGSGCHMGSDLQRAQWLVDNNTLVGHSHNGQYYTSFSVHPSQVCDTSTAGRSIVVLESCGGWQTGLEGRSGYQCQGSNGDGRDGYWD